MKKSQKLKFEISTNFFSKSTVIYLLFIAFLLNSCKTNVDVIKKLPTLTTLNITNITTTSAVSGGSIINDGDATINVRGVVWSTSPNSNISLTTRTTDGTGIGNFTSNLSGLTASTKYYIKAYATNSEGTSYGDELTFSTNASLPIISTNPLSNITTNSAISGGSITDDGGGTIIAKGVVWSINPNPTISLATKTNDGTGLGNFISNLSGLTFATKYYMRAYATNSVGTVYGNELAFQTIASLINLDNAVISKLNQYNIPALSIAIVKNERIVYVKSYGFSNKETNKVASNEDLYRIASISKPITAIAILKLVQDGLISLDQKVFGTNGILGNDYGSPPAGSNKDLISVRHLLDHKSGWTNLPNDPMFSNISNTQSQLISDLLVNRPLQTTPGLTYYYLNFGYCVLGRVIEKVTKMKYESYVRSNILQQCGISEMKIAGNALNDRYPKEVKYYQSEFSPYVMNITRMDSHGGWIASATDLARFIVKIDRNTSKTDLISANLLNQFYFGYTSWWHSGSLPGTSTILNRLNDTFSFVVLSNTRTESDASIILNDLNNTIGSQIKSVTNWPTIDLF
jgi:CubicO group peptidase (beta-lactamase class C family)